MLISDAGRLALRQQSSSINYLLEIGFLEESITGYATITLNFTLQLGFFKKMAFVDNIFLLA